jgi:hypothetical protein
MTTTMTTMRRCRTAFSCGRGLAVQACLMCLWCKTPPASLEASLAAPPRKPRNPARKRVTKKMKVTETTPQEVRCLD